MSRPVEVVVSDLHLAATRLRDAGQRLQDGLSGVDLETRELLGSGWKGDAASAFAAAWEQWHTGAGQVVRGVQTMSDLLKVAGDQYARTDEQGAGALASTVSGSSSGPGSPSSAATTQSSAAPAPAPAPGSGSGTGAAAQVGQLGGQVASGLAQAGQSAAGFAQQVGQAVEQVVEKAVEQSAKPEDRDDASPGDDANTRPAPVDQNRADPQTRDGEVPR